MKTKELETFEVTIEGIRPLLMHKPPVNLGERGRGSNIPDPRDEAIASLYTDDNGEIIIPSLNLLALLRAAAVDYKVPGKSKKTFKSYIFAGVAVDPPEVPLLIPSGDDPKEAWEIDRRPAGMNRKSRILRSRPRFNKWMLKFHLKILDPIIKPTTLQEILEAAGKYTGLGDFRPLFGLFEVKEFEKV